MPFGKAPTTQVRPEARTQVLDGADGAYTPSALAGGTCVGQGPNAALLTTLASFSSDSSSLEAISNAFALAALKPFLSELGTATAEILELQVISLVSSKIWWRCS